MMADRLFSKILAPIFAPTVEDDELRRLLSNSFLPTYPGRKKALTPERVQELCARVGNGETKAVLAREFGISRETLYQYLRQNARTRNSDN